MNFKDQSINDLFETVKAYLTNTVNVFPLKSILKVNQFYKDKQCGPDNIQFPAKHIQDGIPDVDLLIYVITQVNNPTINAYSVICNQGIQNTGDGRETVGYININLQNLQNDYTNGIGNRWINTIIHEIFHTMAFSPFLYDKFRDSNGFPMKIDKVIKKSNGRTFFIVQPLLDYAKQYFKCDFAEGVPLEDNGGDGSADYHFERTAFGNEQMTAGTMGEDVFSMFTLKFLESTGWYLPNYDMAQPFFWGQGEGCDFLNSKCPQNGKEFCIFSKKDQLQCSFDNSGIALCYDKDQFAPQCPYWKSYNNLLCKAPASNSYIKDINEYDGSVNGLSSCLNTNIPANDGFKINKMLVNANCFTTFCQVIDNKQVLFILLMKSSTLLNCTQSQKQLNTAEGVIICPDLDQYCNQQSACADSCNNKGFCKNGKCNCFKGYSGLDCKTKN